MYIYIYLCRLNAFLCNTIALTTQSFTLLNICVIEISYFFLKMKKLPRLK